MKQNNENLSLVNDVKDMAKAEMATEVPSRSLTDINGEYTKFAMLAGDKAFRMELLKAESQHIFMEMQKLNEEGLAFSKAEKKETTNELPPEDLL